MALNRLKSGYISNTTHDGGNAANAAVIGYSTANNRVEFIEATVDTSALDTISANVSNYSAQLTANINTVAANADTLVVGVDAAEASLDGVSDNVDSFATYANSTFVSDGIAANTFITIETNTLLDGGFSSNVTANASADVLTFTAGNGVAFLANASAQSITIAAKLSEIAHDRFTADGTANTFTLSREAAAADELIVYVDGVLQVPANNYTVSSTTLTLANVLPLINGTLVDVRHLPVSGSEGELSIIPPFEFQAATYLYAFGGINQPSSSPSNTDVIERISVISDTDATDVGETFVSGNLNGGAAGDNDVAYVFNKNSGAAYKRFPFASGSESGSPVSLSPYANEQGVALGSDGTFAYFGEDAISRVPFASGATARTNVGDSFNRNGVSTQSSETHGYITGGKGNYPYAQSDLIEKYSFASSSTITDVGESSDADFWLSAGSSSPTHGYIMGGERTNGNGNGGIDKFPFASDSPTTVEISGARSSGFGGSATGHGYFAGGQNNNNSGNNGISKFPYASDTNATSVGSLTQFKRNRGSASLMAND